MAANLALRHTALRVASYLALGLGLTAQLLFALVGLARPGQDGGLVLLGGAVLGAALGLVLLWPGPRRGLARFVPIDPDHSVHTLALCVTVDGVIVLVAQQLGTDVISQVARQAPLSPLDVWKQELPFLAAALLGVGLLTRRELGAASARLGWVRPRWWQVLLGLACGGVFIAFSVGMEALAQLVTPGLSNRVSSATGRLFGGLQNPVGIATIALLPAVCEEALFRGALQPRLGLIWTSLVFTAVHTQYGLSLDAVVVLVLAVGLGLIRKYVNTTTSTICHATYNGLQGLLALAPVAIVPALAVQAVLMAILAGGFLSGRLRPSPASPAS